MEAIILAGGFGTRLASVLADRPKALAPIQGEPFLILLLRRLAANGFHRAIVSTGYKAEMIEAELNGRSGLPEIVFSRETEPLGTGGAASLAMRLVDDDDVFVFNGDTWVNVDYEQMLAFHLQMRARVTIAAVKVPDIARYGKLGIEENWVVHFGEKAGSGCGLISAGVYLLHRDVFDAFSLPHRFSIEQEFFSQHLAELKPVAFCSSGGFIDIGIPEDLLRAQTLLGTGKEQDVC